ncbi:MAG: hypothetical protein JXA33_07375 [Anaerolineae bacterium]|nr:hypothetical protein [Anaerolineae bacterium]
MHKGILIVYRDADMTKNMSYADIVRAIGNLATADMPITGHIYVLMDSDLLSGQRGRRAK